MYLIYRSFQKISSRLEGGGVCRGVTMPERSERPGRNWRVTVSKGKPRPCGRQPTGRWRAGFTCAHVPPPSRPGPVADVRRPGPARLPAARATWRRRESDVQGRIRTCAGTRARASRCRCSSAHGCRSDCQSAFNMAHFVKRRLPDCRQQRGTLVPRRHGLIRQHFRGLMTLPMRRPRQLQGKRPIS